MDNVDNLPGVFVKLNNKSTFQFRSGNSLKKESIKNYYSNYLKSGYMRFTWCFTLKHRVDRNAILEFTKQGFHVNHYC